MKLFIIITVMATGPCNLKSMLLRLCRSYGFAVVYLPIHTARCYG